MSKPQKLGILPTYGFWNDRKRQELVLPIVALIALPVTPLLFLLVAQLQLSVWLLLAGSTLYPYLIMGLVERHVRKELGRRSSEDRLISVPVSASPAESQDRSRPATLAVLCFVMAMLAVFNVNRAVMLVALVLGVGGALAVILLPRTRRIANQLGHSGQGAKAQLPKADDQ